MAVIAQPRSSARRTARASAPPRRRSTADPAPRRVSRTPLRGVVVMVVEDHDDTREVLRQTLAHAGARVLLAEHGRAALALLEGERPHIILCDLLMPELDGLALARHIEADLRWRKIPVLAVTALGAAADYIRTWAHGFAGHMVKPINPDDLIHAIRLLIGRKTR